MSRNESENGSSSLNPIAASHSDIIEGSEADSASRPEAEPNGGVLVDDLNVAHGNGSVWLRPPNGKSDDENNDLRDYLLCLDGGGIRGYSTLLILRDLMHRIGEREQQRPCGNDEGASHSHSPAEYELPKGHKNTMRDIRQLSSYRYLPCHYFDFVAGTSTGGLIAIMLGRLRMTVEDCISEYETLGDKIFGHPRWWSLRGPLPALRDKYNNERLAAIVQDVVRRHNPSSDESNNVYFASDKDLCRTIVVSIRKDQGAEGEGPYLFRSFPSQRRNPPTPLHRNPGDACKDAVSDVALATAAAPTYFAQHRIGDNVFMDGGFGANNPTVEAYREIQQVRNRQDAVGLVLSIGTGKSKPLSRFGRGLFGKYWASLKFTRKMASESETLHLEMNRTAWAENQRRPAGHRGANGNSCESLRYERFNVETGLENMKLDDWKSKHWKVIPRESNKTLDCIKTATETYLREDDVQIRLDEVAEMLVDRRRLRVDMQKPAWERWSSGCVWRCNNCGQDPFLASSELESHLSLSHSYPSGSRATNEEKAQLARMVKEARSIP